MVNQLILRRTENYAKHFLSVLAKHAEDKIYQAILQGYLEIDIWGVTRVPVSFYINEVLL